MSPHYTALQARLTQWPQVTIRGLPPLILWSPSLAFWFRASIQRARTLWLESWLLEHYCAFEQVIYFSGPVFSCCSNAADEPLCTVSKNVRFSKKLKMDLPHNPAIPLLGVHPKEWKIGSQRDTCTPIFIAALITIAESWKQPRCPSSKKWINVMRSIHALKYYSALKTLTFLIHATTWRKLENIMLSDIIQILYDSTSMKYWEQSKIIEMESRMVGTCLAVQWLRWPCSAGEAG